MTKPIAPVLRDNLLRCARAYIRLNGGTLETVGRASCDDPPFFVRLDERMTTENGVTRSFTARKYDELIAWFVVKLGDAMPDLKNPDHQQRKANGKKGR